MSVRDDIAADLDSLYDVVFGFAEIVNTADRHFPGIFSAEYYFADAGGSVGVRSASPALRTQDEHALEEGDIVYIRGNQYTVIEPRPDGYGETVHGLREV